MRKRLLLFFMFCAFGLLAQEDRLQQVQQTINQYQSDRLTRVEAFIKQTAQPKVITFDDAPALYLYDVINNKPIYLSSDNLGAAVNVNTDQLITGDAGLVLNGEGLRLLIWEEPGGPRESHAEFEDRLLPGGDFESNAPVNHSTHVTGTIIGAGINSEARGMAPKAGAVVYNFTNDEAEIAEELANNAETMILSNHSYGVPAGWRRDGNSWSWFGDEDIDPNEDWKFGFYNSSARNWDQLVYNAPYYLMVKSVGNSRNGIGDGSKPPNGPYDQIVFQSAAKNIVTVGATRKFSGSYTNPTQIEMSNFSSWGPTDDGRIKPDISAPGVSILSSAASADNAYLRLQGTSMSSPVVMGSLALIQELHQKTNGQFMKAATLKALLLHTAHEAGDAAGPDYEFGWGFINTKGMADFLLKENGDNRAVIVDSLAEGETDTYTIQPRAGSRVKVTMVWTDVPGTPVAPQLDPEDLMLVNDLDMRVTREGEAHLPWILDPAVPSEPATKGDNFRDNVEKIEFEATGGAYTLTVSHKNSITNDVQEYALVIEYEKDNAPQTYYWIGGSGNWEDAANWSLSSGGTVASVAPSSNDQVIFDRNSFSTLAEQDPFTIQLGANTAVAEFSWFGDKVGELRLNGNQLTVAGDVYLSDENVTVQGGEVVLLSSAEQARVFAGADLTSTTLVVNAQQGEVDLVGRMRLADLVIESGDVNFSGDTLTVDNWIARTASAKSFSSSNAVIQVRNSISWVEQLSLTNSNILLEIPSGATATGTFGNLDLNAELVVNGTLTVDQLPSLQKLRIAGSISFDSPSLADSLFISQGGSLNLQANASFNVLEGFIATGTTDQRTSITGAGGNRFSVSGHQKVCQDFMTVNNVDYVGEATLTIGTNSQVTNASGWLEQTCEETLFADFDFQYGCAAGLTFFENKSTGPVRASFWAANGQAVENDGTGPLAGAAISFEAEGTFAVELEVEGTEAPDAYVRDVNIVVNTIDPFNVIQQQGIMVSEQIGDRYQWFKDGIAIPNETTRQYETEEPGSYQLLVYDEICNRFSNPFEITVTAIDDEPSPALEAAVNIYPNPVEERIQVDIQGIALTQLSIELLDMKGKVYSTDKFRNLATSNYRYGKELSGLAPGIYILRMVLNEEAIITKKIWLK